jgi:hypothetical protein
MPDAITANNGNQAREHGLRRRTASEECVTMFEIVNLGR